MSYSIFSKSHFFNDVLLNETKINYKLSMENSISFLLPGIAGHPSGGTKVVFEYANYLAKHGFKVHIAYAASINFKSSPIMFKMITILKFPYRLFMSRSSKSWFNLNDNVKEHFVLSLNQRHVPKTEYYVATSLPTSFYLKSYNIPDDRKLYLIQDFENWGTTEEKVYESYRLGLRNIVIANWLREKVNKAGVDSVLIPNGFDFDYFCLNHPIELRSQYVVSMLFNEEERKGCKYGIEALNMVKAKFPQLKAILFGTPNRPNNLPDWIEYYRCPNRKTHNHIYNTSSIYIAPSVQEGWGLTVGEAMICGNAIICTEALGFQEMVTNGKEGFIVPCKNAEALAEGILSLIENPKKRIDMARAAVNTISNFNWNRSFKSFESLLNIKSQSDKYNLTTDTNSENHQV